MADSAAPTNNTLAQSMWVKYMKSKTTFYLVGFPLGRKASATNKSHFWFFLNSSINFLTLV